MPNGRKQRLLMKWDVRRGGFRRLSKNTNSEVNLRCNMCEFCEKIYKPSDIIDAPKIVYGNYCGNDSDMYYISVPTDDGIDYSIDNIKFCPICGRKLVKE